MSECNFYVPDGAPIGKDEFVALYSKSYYLGSPKIKAASGSTIGQNSKIIEDEIDRILENGIKTKLDVAHILAWKTGKIKHKESDKNNRFEYAKDWKHTETFNVMRYGRPFELDRIAEFITYNIHELEQQAITNPQAVLNKLCEENFKGIGTVYLVTLLYFISKGVYPIYDRFAAMALYAILNNIKPGEIVSYNELPNKQSKAFTEIMSKDMKEYIRQIECIFNKKYQDNRDIDRALWVYGHLFRKK